MNTITVDLDALRDEAHAWLLAQPCDHALDPFAADYFRRRFCLPYWIVAAVRDEEEDDA